MNHKGDNANVIMIMLLLIILMMTCNSNHSRNNNNMIILSLPLYKYDLLYIIIDILLNIITIYNTRPRNICPNLLCTYNRWGRAREWTQTDYEPRRQCHLQVVWRQWVSEWITIYNTFIYLYYYIIFIELFFIFFYY